ncbi:MAG: sodium ion-translocating decarboxylase subunit beta [Endozoicomonas sp.]
MDKIIDLWQGSGLYNMTGGQLAMIVVGIVLLYLAIRKQFEPLLLVPIGFGGILANIPEAGLAYSGIEMAVYQAKPQVMEAIVAILGADLGSGKEVLTAYAEAGSVARSAVDAVVADARYTNGVLYQFYDVAIASGVAPLLIFMGVGAMTDFGPLLANPKTLFLGAAAQFGIFATVLGALALNMSGIMSFSLADAAAIGIIGGADGPTAIYVSSVLSPHLLGAIAVAAYSYMALVPLIQPPIMKALTTEEERRIVMTQLRTVSKTEKIVFPLMLLILVALLLPSAAPLLGMFCFGNLMKECGVVERLSDTAQNALINIVTIFLGLSVGSKLVADKFLQAETLGILSLGIVAFCIGTATGVLMAKLMNRVSQHKVNPLIGSAGVSAVPMAARVSNKLGLEANPQNFLLMHAMGPNVAGVIGSAVAAGVMIQFLS